jgi:glycosyltransferase involved in cell wall biosynthesis
MGRVVLEAFAFGQPVIGASRGGIPELIDQDRGWIFDPDKGEELKGILQRCIDQPQRLDEMRSAARAASLRFSGEAMLAGYLDAYRDAMQRSP